MIRNNNSALSQELRDVLKIQGGYDSIPTLTENKIVPVVDVNPKHSRIINVVKSANSAATGTTAIYTIPANSDFYLMGFSCGFDADATCDGTAVTITATMGGAVNNICDLRKLTTTAQQQQVFLSFPIPIKLDRGSVVNLNGTFTAGAEKKVAVIYGYILDNDAA